MSDKETLISMKLEDYYRSPLWQQTEGRKRPVAYIMGTLIEDIRPTGWVFINYMVTLAGVEQLCHRDDYVFIDINPQG